MMQEVRSCVHFMTYDGYNAIFIYFSYSMSRRLEPNDVAAIEKVRAALSHSSSHSSNTLEDQSTLDDTNLDPLHAHLLIKDKITNLCIVGHDLIPNSQEKREFASYEVEVSTVDLSYRLSRRFSEFHQLYRQVRKILNLKCDFPRKVYNPFMSSTSPAVVEQRSSKLHFFLKELLNHVRTSRDPAVTLLLFNFLAIKENYEQKQLTPNYKKCNSEKLAYYRMISMKPTLSEGLTPPDQNTLEFKLALLASNGSGDKCLRDIEDLLKVKRNKFSLQEIKVLFVGDGQCPGLLRYGLSNSSETNRIIAFEILLGVLLPERNPQSEKFQRVLERLLTEEWRVREISMLENAQFKVLYFRLLSLYCERVERQYARPEKTVLQDLFLFHRDLLNDYSAWKKVHEGELGIRKRLKSDAGIDHARKIELTEFQEDKEELVRILSCEEPIRRVYVSHSDCLLVLYFQTVRQLQEKELIDWSRNVQGVSVDEYTSMVRATFGLGRKKISLRVRSVKPHEAGTALERHQGLLKQVMDLQEAGLTEECDWMLVKEEYPVEFESEFDEITWVKREQGCSKALIVVHFAAGLAGTSTTIEQLGKDMLDDLASLFPL